MKTNYHNCAFCKESCTFYGSNGNVVSCEHNDSVTITDGTFVYVSGCEHYEEGNFVHVLEAIKEEYGNIELHEAEKHYYEDLLFCAGMEWNDCNTRTA